MSRTAPLAIAALLALPCPVAAQDGALEGLSWTAQKCVLYQRAVGDALGILGEGGIGAGFLAENEAFIDGGCIGRVHICPVTEQEYALVDLLTVMTMNEGMASSFVPFGCRD